MVDRAHFISGSRRVPRQPRRLASGFTLIEVLVAVLVLCFGMLGVVGLQTVALQANKEARNQSSAVRMARELAEMMRANAVIAATATVATNPYLISGTSAPAAAANCFESPCATAMDVARSEISEWFQRISSADSGLPGVRVDVCFDSAPYDGNGLPQWNCVAPVGAVNGQAAYIKIGWTQQSTNRSSDGSAGAPVVLRATDAGSRPLVVVPVMNGSW